MTPSEIASNSTAINSYKYSVLLVLSDYAEIVNKKLQYSVNKKDIEQLKLNKILLSLYVEIVLDYITSTVESDENFFTFEEFKKAMTHINRITNSNYWLELV
jgi:hypothetical protein